MKERPILFTGEMVKAILEGRKTQTRRVQPLTAKTVLCAAQRKIGFEFNAELARRDYPVKGMPRLCVPVRHPKETWIKLEDCGCEILYCPYGGPGDMLWVRETWSVADHDFGTPPTAWLIDYKATDTCEWQNPPKGTLPLWAERIGTAGIDFDPKCRPSIFMPRWASRITLQILSVRVERVQEISEEDAKAEGSYLGRCDCSLMKNYTEMFTLTWCHIHGQEFKTLWDSINSKRGFGWEKNPWCWVVEFKRI